MQLMFSEMKFHVILDIHVLDPTNTASSLLMCFHKNIREFNILPIQACFPHLYVIKSMVTDFFIFFSSLCRWSTPPYICFLES